MKFNLLKDEFSKREELYEVRLATQEKMEKKNIKK